MIENPIPWPNGARCAAAITFDMDAESLLHLHHGATAPNRVALASLLRYGPEVAIPRIVDAFARLGLKQTFFIPAWCIQTYPRAIELILRGGHEIGHHGYIHENPNALEREQEREFLHRGIDIIAKATGARPTGYRAPSYAFSRHTLDLLLEAGFDYDASLLGHDIPYMIASGSGQLVELPGDLSLDDWPQYANYKEFGWSMPIASPARAMEVFRAEFDAHWKHGGLWIGIWHPFVSGRLSRCDAIVGLVDYMQAKGGVWFARMDEIAAHVRRCIADGSFKPRIDQLPFWETALDGIPPGRTVLP